MAKFEFKKNEKKQPRPIHETKISQPRETYDPSQVSETVQESIEKQPKKKRVGRPKSGRKSYQTVRLEKSTVLKINALENALGIKTQDETVDQAIDRVLRSLSSDERRAYSLWLDMFERKEKK